MSDIDTAHHSSSSSTFPSKIINYIWNSGSACIAIAALVFSIAASLVRPLSSGIGVFQIVSTRSALSLIFSHILYHFSGQTTPLYGERQHMPFLALRGLVGNMAMNCHYSALLLLPLADAVSLLFLNPVLTAILAMLLLKETLTWKAFGGSLTGLAGMLLVVRPPFLVGSELFGSGNDSSTDEWTSQRVWGVSFGLASAFLAAGAYLTIRMIGKKASAISIAVWFHTTALAHTSILLLFGWPRPAVWPTLLDWGCLSAIAVASFTANILLNRGFQIESASLASAINTSQVIYSHIIGILVLHEDISWIGAFGAGMITVGVCIVALENKSNKIANDAGKVSTLDYADDGIEMNERSGRLVSVSGNNRL
jgi:drug/metabolite transporter (DMT)-like permease